MNDLSLKRVFVLGAGFSRAIRSTCVPLNKDLYDILYDKLPSHLRDKTDKKDIELVLTYLDLEIMNGNGDIPALRALRDEVRDNIESELRKHLPKEINDYTDCGKYYVNLLKRNDTLITFNYDTYTETLLWLQGKWSRNGGYSKHISNFLIKEPKNNENGFMNVEILKLHGSINFRVGETLDKKDPYIGLAVDNDIFPDSHQNFGIVDDKGSHLILPTYLKTYYFREISFLWQEAYDKISEAFNIIVIGYSFPNADILAQNLLSFIRYDKGPDLKSVKRRIFVVDPYADVIIEKIKKSILINPANVSWVTITGNLEDRMVELKDKLELL